MPSVDFYVLDGDDERARWRFACRQIEQAYLDGQRVLVCLDDESQLAAFDELLWTFGDRSFVPHEPLSAAADWEATPVQLGTPAAAAPGLGLIVNLAGTLPASIEGSKRVLEIIDADPDRRAAGRQRYRSYRDLGLKPNTHQTSSGA
ncbi:MAG TPA: DNA polymerase III subunit chi [Steroidobacteraceae bacterium]